MGPPPQGRQDSGLPGNHSVGQEGSLLPFVWEPEDQGARGAPEDPGGSHSSDQRENYQWPPGTSFLIPGNNHEMGRFSNLPVEPKIAIYSARIVGS